MAEPTVGVIFAEETVHHIEVYKYMKQVVFKTGIIGVALLFTLSPLFLCGCKKTIAVESIRLNPESMELYPEDKSQILIYVHPSNAEDYALQWETSDSKIATVDQTGMVTAHNEGSATITVTVGGKQASCHITVLKPQVKVTSIELDKTQVEILEGDYEKVTASVSPNDAADKTITWMSSDLNIVNVSGDGIIFAVSPGNATITATSGSVSKSCSVTVKECGLIFTADLSGCTIRIVRKGVEAIFSNDVSLEYRIDNGEWRKYDFGTYIPLSKQGDKVSFRAAENSNTFSEDSDNRRFQFGMDGSMMSIRASGNIAFLIDKTGERTDCPPYSFAHLFQGCYELLTAPKIPFKTLGEHCFESMFEDCQYLKEAPDLPATVLAESCYERMFAGCRSLNSGPNQLPAKELSKACYSHMFMNCSHITNAPELPATQLSDYCYAGMFYNCFQITSAPALPATVLSDYCYWGMFYGCSRLTSAPALPATVLSDYCYWNMFYSCSKLTKAPILPAVNLAESCYRGMFLGCESLKEAPALPSENLAESCYQQMFYMCASLSNPPTLPALVLTESCYRSMFYGCHSIEEAPQLPSTTLAPNCYRGMFGDCLSLRIGPDLPAEELVDGCYQGMFSYCQSLSSLKVAFTNWNDKFTFSWLDVVALDGSFYCPSLLPEERGESRIPQGWAIEYL